MAYDPKAFLTRALKEGFQPQYSGPQTSEDTSLTYLGDLATIDGVQVRPMTIGGTEEAPEYGHIVSAPLTGEYEGYFRNDIYDDKGNFLRTTISEPGTSGLTDLAKFGLNAATFGGFGPAVTAAARGISALQAKNVPGLLSAISGLPGVPSMPSGISSILKYAGQAQDISKALKGDPGAIFKTIVGAAQTGGLGKGFAGELDLSEPIQEGFFEPGGPGYMPSDTAAFPEDFGYVSEQPSGAATSMSPNEMSQFLEANVEDPGTIETLMQDYFPDLYTQRIETTAKRETPGRSIRDVGPVTQITAVEPLEGADIAEPDLSKNLTPAQVGKTTPGKATTPAKPSAPGKLDLSQLAFLLGMMQHKPKEEEEEAQASQEFPVYGSLMYGLPGRYEG